ncbi:ABC transporter ATP-binding protein [Ornithobacterium rhinotracheale]|uniref:ABC transporter ATP-binding protein n=1 Tax=Ornithobacterium rhinotracheale TaxID=28251 RepID=A0A410JQC8_ORNRH|nr:ABC transporter ATP-binding protein [Ornithobacterium rhinotracheale]QAR30291.1 ABC transporter ATP-binding protein [Ornithobacterium rhinotracheale]
MLSVENLQFKYSPEVAVLKNIHFKINSTERTCILGESGSGKSTLLKLIYGILEPDAGQIFFNGDLIKGPKQQLIPGHEDMKYVAQDFDLSLYMTVAENVGKHLSNIYQERKKQRVAEILEVLSLSEFAHRRPVELSGGQQQRVAIARTLAKMPKMLILDEPFSHLDAALHIKIRQQLIQYCEEQNMGVLFSSHRADDALGYADRLIIMKKGEILQIGTPQDIYLAPKNLYVAELFGKVNHWEAHDCDMLQIPNPTGELCLSYLHELKITPHGIPMQVKHSRFIGRGYEISLEANGTQAVCYAETPYTQGETLGVAVQNYRFVKG